LAGKNVIIFLVFFLHPARVRRWGTGKTNC